MCAVEVAPNKCFCVEFLQVRTGGKGSVRRKKKAVHKTAGTDDKRLQNTLKRLGVNNIPGIEEVNLFRDDGSIVHFKNPKQVQASIGANTYVIRCNSNDACLVCCIEIDAARVALA